MSAGVRRVGYQPVVPSAVRAEVQRLDAAHEVTGYGPHSHDFFEVVVFDSSGGQHVIAGEPIDVSAGHVWLLAPGVIHDLGGVGTARGWVLIIGSGTLDLTRAADALRPWPGHPLLSGFQHLDGRRRPVPLLLAGEDLARWAGWLDEITREREAAAAGYEHAVRALIHLLLVDAHRRSLRSPAAVRTGPLVEKALAVVEARFHAGLTVSGIARELAVTPGHLSDLVSRQTGRPLGEWIQDRRLAQARKLLAETALPVGVIAASVGFADAGSFSRQFRRRHGQGPSAWRAAVQRAHSPARPSTRI